MVIKQRVSNIENVLFVYFLGRDEFGVEKEFIEVSSGLIAYLSEHSVVWERLKVADLVLNTSIDEINDCSAFGHGNKGSIFVSFADAVWLDNGEISLLNHDWTDEYDMSGIYLFPEDSFDFVVNFMLTGRLPEEVHDYRMIVASNGIKVDIMFVLELLPHNVAKIRTLSVDD